MRISYWSAYVCSYYLVVERSSAMGGVVRWIELSQQHAAAIVQSNWRGIALRILRGDFTCLRNEVRVHDLIVVIAYEFVAIHLKSVVKGKMVADRVDLAVRSNLQINNNNHQINT